MKTTKKGFTLMEVLLAVLIVGLIGVALASLTRSASRESNVGRTKLTLRNNLSVFMNILRGDLRNTSYLNYVQGDTSDSKKLLELWQNMRTDGTVIDSTKNRSKVVYCYVKGGDDKNISPAGSYRGGTIYRIEATSATAVPAAPNCNSLPISKKVLSFVKDIPSSAGYQTPLFKRVFPNMLSLRIIVELESKPIINDVIEEEFTIAGGKA